MEVIWKPIIGYENYSISNSGIIKNNKTNKILKLRKHKTGYLYILLCKNGKYKSFTIHRLVALHFIDNPNNKLCVNHIDNNKENNVAENLEWCSQKENIEHCINQGRFSFNTDNIKPKRKIKQYDLSGNFLKIYDSVMDVIKDLEVKSYGNISRCCMGIRPTAYGYIWRYDL